MSLEKWIECKSELPDSETTVLAYTPDFDDDYICFAYHDGEQWCDIFGEPFTSRAEITHWMDVPAPPCQTTH